MKLLSKSEIFSMQQILFLKLFEIEIYYRIRLCHKYFLGNTIISLKYVNTVVYNKIEMKGTEFFFLFFYFYLLFFF